MRKTILMAALLLVLPTFALGNTVASSTMQFQGTLTDNGDGTYTGVVPMINGTGFDVFAAEGETAYFGDDPGTGPVWTTQTIAANDAWPTWTPDTPDWYQYSISFYEDGGLQRWALRNHPGATAANPWYDEVYWGAGGKPAMGVPMSGVVNWGSSYAAETDVGAYLPGTGTPEIPGGAASQGGGRAAWDMDWSWGSEVVPLATAGFAIDVQPNGAVFDVTLTPADAPLVVDAGWTAFIIRENSTEGAPLIYGNSSYGVDAVEFAIFASSQKAGLGTNDINGAKVSGITTLHVDRLDDVANSGSLYGPYFNIWVTDGLGNYAVIANEPSNGEWGGDPWDVSNWDDLKTKTCKVYETAGWNTGTSWVHTYAGSSGTLTFEDVAGLTIEPPSAAYIAASPDIGSGAPDELGTNIAYGYNWIFGDTASNYVTGDGEGFVVANYSATATFPVTNVTQGTGYGAIQPAIDAANPNDVITVAAGTYVESLLIEKPLTLLGATAGVNKNGYAVPAGYLWDDTVETVITHPNPASGYVTIVDIHDTDDVTFDGFVVGELYATGNANTSLVRVYAHTREITNINVINNVIGPNTNVTAQDGAQGRMGLYIVNHPYGDQGVVNSTFAGNKIFDCKGNGDNVFLWSSYYAYGAPGPADMTGTVIRDNEIYGAHRSGIETAGGYAHLTISDNTIYGQTGLPADDPDFLKYGHGIQLIRGSSDKVSDPLTAYGPVDLTIEGNEIYGNQKCGVYMGPKNQDISFVDNVIRDNGWDGIMLDLEGNYWNPQFESPPVSGAYACFDCSENVSASGNDIHGNGTGGNVLAHHGIQLVGTPTNAFQFGAESNWWGDASGPLDSSDDTGTGGLYNPGGLGDEVTDLVLYRPWTGMATIGIAPAATGPVTCGLTVPLTVSYTSDASTPDLFLYNMVLSAGAAVSLPATAAGFHGLEPFGGAAHNENFLVYANGDGTWTVTGSTVANSGQEIPASTTVDLFTVDLTTVTDGLADVTISSLTLRDPANTTFFGTAGSAAIEVDCSAPAAVTAITAVPGHNKVDVSWTHNLVDVDHFEVYRGMWYAGTTGNSAYPEYDDQVGSMIPTRPTAYGVFPGPANEWVRVDGGAVSTTAFNDTWTTPLRGVYYYEVFAVDAAGNGSPPAAANDRATNYWLGDVYGSSAVDPVPNGKVDVWDMNELGASFGNSLPLDDPANVLDVGPTDDWSRVGIPTTDSLVNFEDLMVFSMNFGIVGPAKTAPVISPVVQLAWVRYDDGRQALRLVEGSGVKGLNVRSDMPVSGVVAGELLDQQSELTFLKNVGDNLDVSVAVTGVDIGFAGSGDLFIIDADGQIDVSDLTIKVRGSDNSRLEYRMNEKTGTLTPRVFALNPNYPNPFNPMTKISFSLPDAQHVKLAVYGIDGRKVATLLDETRGPGLHEVIWNGQDDSGRQSASGMYFYRIDAGPYSQVHKMTLMK